MSDWKSDRASAEMKENDIKMMAAAKLKREAEEAAKPKEYNTVEEITQKINDWEEENGESFTDYFMHDRVKNLSWGFWLLGKGHTEHADKLIDKMTEEGADCYIDQDELYEIHNPYPDGYEEGYSDDAHQKNIVIWAEFLSATKTYRERVNKFFNPKEEETND